MMKVTLKAENKFTLEIGDKSFPNMRLTSRWEGFMKLEGPNGSIAIVNDDREPITRTIDELFMREAKGLTILKATPEIAAALHGDSPDRLDVSEPPVPADVRNAEFRPMPSNARGKRLTARAAGRRSA